MNILKRARVVALTLLTALFISPPSFAILTELPGYEDGVTIISKSKAINEEETNYKGSPIWSVAKIDEQLYSFRFQHYQSFFMLTPDGVIVGDPNNEEMAALMLQEIKKLTQKPVKLVIYSHDHWDHTIGAQVFKDQGATILGHETTTASMKNMNKMFGTDPKALIPDLSWYGDRYVVPLGNTGLELRYYGEDHGSGMVVYHFTKQKIVHLTDIISPNRMPAGEMPDMFPRQILNTLQEVAKLDFDQVMAGHEPWVLFPRAAVDDMAEFYADMYIAVDAALAKFGPGPVPWLVVPVMEKPMKYKSWYFFNEWWTPIATRFVTERLLGF